MLADTVGAVPSTVTVAVSVKPFSVATVIVTVPSDTPVTFPFSSTVATVGSELVHVKSVLSLEVPGVNITSKFVSLYGSSTPITAWLLSNSIFVGVVTTVISTVSVF